MHLTEEEVHHKLKNLYICNVYKFKPMHANLPPINNILQLKELSMTGLQEQSR
jgi:hypothetical protein